jgi:Fe-S cluster biogenesis protein NfuA
VNSEERQSYFGGKAWQSRRLVPAHPSPYIALMLIETETTPNPASLKFLPGRAVMGSGGTREFANPEAAEASPLAQALFDTGEVTGVFFGSDFVTVTAAPGVDWRHLKPDVLGILLDHFVSEAPLFAPASAAGIAVPSGEGDETLIVEHDPADEDIVAQINELLETRVRPAVAGDGGDIRYRGYRDGVVYLAMQGACSGCPSSTATLKHGIEGLLKHYVPEVTEVRAA